MSSFKNGMSCGVPPCSCYNDRAELQGDYNLSSSSLLYQNYISFLVCSWMVLERWRLPISRSAPITDPAAERTFALTDDFRLPSFPPAVIAPCVSVLRKSRDVLMCHLKLEEWDGCVPLCRSRASVCLIVCNVVFFRFALFCSWMWLVCPVDSRDWMLGCLSRCLSYGPSCLSLSESTSDTSSALCTWEILHVTKLGSICSH